MRGMKLTDYIKYIKRPYIKRPRDGKRVRAYERSWPYYFMIAVAVYALAVGLWARLYNLSFPPKEIFDELLYRQWAIDYLQGVPVADVHPPLGKFILAAGIALLGDTPLGWRLMPALFGCALVGLGAVLGQQYLKERLGALLLASFIASETIFITYSRLGLLDGLLLVFVLATVLAAYLAERKGQVVWVAIMLGLALSIKWTIIGVIVPVSYILWCKRLLKPFLASLGISLAIYLMFVFAGQVLNGVEVGELWPRVWQWHRETYAFHAQLGNTHPFHSTPLSWPLMLKPMTIFNETDAAGSVYIISAIGNPVLWWSSTLAIVYALYEVAFRRIARDEPVADHPLVPVLLGYGAVLLPWAMGDRDSFIYHYFPAYLFALLALVYGLRRLWKYQPWMVVVFTACVVTTGLFYLPMVMALPMSPVRLHQHLWLESWL